MATIHLFDGSTHTTPNRRSLSLLKGFWSVLQDWHARAKLRARLSALSDVELRDIGISRSEIDYVVRNRSQDPRGAVR